MQSFLEGAGIGQRFQIVIERFLQVLELCLALLQLGKGTDLRRDRFRDAGQRGLLFVVRVADRGRDRVDSLDDAAAVLCELAFLRGQSLSVRIQRMLESFRQRRGEQVLLASLSFGAVVITRAKRASAPARSVAPRARRRDAAG